jgi:hypothetical protein
MLTPDVIEITGPMHDRLDEVPGTVTRDLVDATIEGEMTKIEERVGPRAYARGLTLPAYEKMP